MCVDDLIRTQAIINRATDSNTQRSFEINENEFNTLTLFGFNGLFNKGINFLMFDEVKCIVSALSDTNNIVARIKDANKKGIFISVKDVNAIEAICTRLKWGKIYSGIV